jgi:hypothetical protein
VRAPRCVSGGIRTVTVGGARSLKPEGVDRAGCQAARRRRRDCDLYRFDRFAAPAKVWDDLQARFPELLNTS